jgi:hypothetical protein
VKKTRQNKKAPAVCWRGEADLSRRGPAGKTPQSGDSFQVPADALHGATAEGDKSLKMIGIYVIDKITSLASPAP